MCVRPRYNRLSIDSESEPQVPYIPKYGSIDNVNCSEDIHDTGYISEDRQPLLNGGDCNVEVRQAARKRAEAKDLGV